MDCQNYYLRLCSPKSSCYTSWLSLKASILLVYVINQYQDKIKRRKETEIRVDENNVITGNLEVESKETPVRKYIKT